MESGGRAFRIALTLHVLALLTLLISMFWSYLFPEKKPEHVFIMVSHVGDPEKEVTQASPKVAQKSKPMPEVTKPELPPMETPEPEPEEAPPPPPKETPKPTPQEKKPKPVAKPIKVESKPVKAKPEKQTPKEETKKVAYDPSKYQKKPTPKKEVKSAPTKPAPVKPVKINTKSLKESVSSMKMDAVSGENLTAAQSLALSSFGDRLRDRINAEWQPPQKQLSAMVKIVVSPDGSLTATISKPSGDYEFDQSILDAIRAIKMEPPPEGKVRTFYIPISNKEE